MSRLSRTQEFRPKQKDSRMEITKNRSTVPQKKLLLNSQKLKIYITQSPVISETGKGYIEVASNILQHPVTYLKSLINLLEHYWIKSA